MLHIKCVLFLNSSLTQLHVIFYRNTIGIHVVHVNLDGIVRAPETSFKLLSGVTKKVFRNLLAIESPRRTY